MKMPLIAMTKLLNWIETTGIVRLILPQEMLLRRQASTRRPMFVIKKLLTWTGTNNNSNKLWNCEVKIPDGVGRIKR